ATDLRARARMRGPWHALAVTAHADLGRGGGLHARATLDATARPVAYAARLAFARLDPGAVLPRLPHVEASGQLAFRGEGGAPRPRAPAPRLPRRAARTRHRGRRRRRRAHPPRVRARNGPRAPRARLGDPRPGPQCRRPDTRGARRPDAARPPPRPAGRGHGQS